MKALGAVLGEPRYITQGEEKGFSFLNVTRWVGRPRPKAEASLTRTDVAGT